MPAIDLSILNQRQTPAFYADVFANRPAAGFVGRIFVSTNTFAFYRDNGTGWDLIGGPGTGTITGSGATGQIALWDGASTITGDSGLTYNGTDNSLTASKFIVTGGTSSQFLKADGSVDSSSYVPYTGATTSLNMGANNISGQNYFINGNGVNSGGYLGIKQYSGTSSGSLGYTSLYAALQNSLYIQYSQTNSTVKTVELSSGLLGTTPRQYQFPDADGTLALTSNIPSVSGAVGQVSYFNGINSITGSNDLFWDSVNGHFGVGTNVPGTALDVHHDQPTVAILNQTVATNDVRIGFQNNGVGLWRIGAFYNAGANDFGIYDAVAAIQPVTVKKTTGQVLIGTSTVGSGKLVVASATGDNGIQIVGATAPSLRIDNAESGPTLRAGLGISTAANNFIQGSANRDFCIFNGTTALASPILFGIYDAGTTNVQEAARISASRNFLIGTTTDTGVKLNVNGTSNFASNVSIGSSGTSDISWGTAGGIKLSRTNVGPEYALNQRWTGSAAYVDIASSNQWNGGVTILPNGGGNVGISTTSPNALFTIGSGYSLEMNINAVTPRIDIIDNNVYTGSFKSFGGLVTLANSSNNALAFSTNGSERMRLNNTGNLLLGTTTDDGEKLQVNGIIKPATGYRQYASGLNIPNNTATTFFTPTADQGLYIVYLSLPAGAGSPANYSAYAIVSFDALASRILQQTDAANLFITLSGNNLQARQTSGGPQDITYRIIKIV